MANAFKTLKRLAVGAAVAGAAGYVAGLLTAPKSGRETRDEFRKSAGKGVSDIENQLKNLHGELGKLVDEARGKSDDLSGKAQKELDGLTDKAKETKAKAQKILNDARQGEVNDKDLKKAITDAKHAIDHLRDYLKK